VRDRHQRNQMITFRRTAIALAVLATVGGAVAYGSAAATSRRPDARGAARAADAQVVEVSGSSSARPLPNGFLGLAIEFRGLEEYVGSDPSSLDPVFLQLVRNLSPGQSPVVRIGGDSTDWSWWPVPNWGTPRWVRYSLDPRWAAVARALAASLGARLIIGINFEADSQKVAATEADSILAAVGTRSLDGLELGNEPELYGAFSWYRTPSGQHVPGRPRSYDFHSYLPDYSHIVAALPNVALAGPGSGSAHFLANLNAYLSSEHRVKLVTIHAYPLEHCTPRQNPTIARLLAPATSATMNAEAEAFAVIAHRHGLPLRIDEMNSVSCGGYARVTEAFAPALWALGELFQLDRLGIDGVSFDTIPHSTQHLILTRQEGSTWSASVQPEYYGLLAFADAAPAGSRMLAVSAPSSDGVQVYATVSPSRVVHVVVINSSGTAHSVDLRIGRVAGAASLALLRAPSLRAFSGVTLGGQSIDPATGVLSGASAARTVTPVGGVYRVAVPAGSAAILTVS
jgi:hypothetical protein